MAGACRLRDSLWLTFTTVISNGAGASLGMEAGYSQLGAGLYSWLGRWFRLRRADLRVFVTAGAGAAIAAAFNAPLAGAFYGYELILGSYTTKALAPVMVATVSRRADPARHVPHEGAVRRDGRLQRHLGKLFSFRAAGRGRGRRRGGGDAGGDLDRAEPARIRPAGLAAARAGRRAAVGAGAVCAAGAGQRPWRGAISFRHPLDLLALWSF